MKYWRGFLVAGICAAITWALVEFAKAHSVLVDMIYPYMARLISTTLTTWTAGMGACLWQILFIVLVLVGVGTLVLAIRYKWSIVQWVGWVTAVVSFVVLLNVGLFGLNRYASPIADDMMLKISDFTVSELKEATDYYRDQANILAAELERDKKGNPKLGNFQETAQQAIQGFRTLTREDAISIFAGQEVPVKKLGFSFLYGKSFGANCAITGEAAVNTSVPDVILPFAMCNQMCHRLSIYSESDAAFGAFLACIRNEDKAFQYAGYLMAYRYCYLALQNIPTSTAQSAANTTDKGVSRLLREDLQKVDKFLGKKTAAPNERGEIPADAAAEDAPIHFSEYDDVSDLLACWYIEKFITPLHKEEESIFDPLDPTQVDLSGIVNAKK